MRGTYTLVVAADVLDGRRWTSARGLAPKDVVIMTPRNRRFVARGLTTDGVVWTAAATQLPADVRDEIEQATAPCLWTPDAYARR